MRLTVACLLLIAAWACVRAEDFAAWQPQKQFGSDFSRHTDRVVGVSFAPDCRTLLSASRDGVIKTWDIPNRRALRTYRTSAWLSAGKVAFSKDGHTVAFGPEESKTARVWDLREGTELCALLGLPSDVVVLTLSHDGALLATAGDHPDFSVRVWDVASQRQECTFTLPRARAYAGRPFWLYFSDDGRALYGGDGGSVFKWDIATGRPVFINEECEPSKAAYAPDTQKLVVACSDDLVVFDALSGKALHRQPHGACDPLALTSMPDGRQAALQYASELTLVSVETGKRTRSLPIAASCSLLAISPDGRLAATAGAENIVRLWDLQTGKEIATGNGHALPVANVLVTADGRCAVSSSSDDTLRVWDVATAGQLRVLQGPHGTRAIALSPDSRQVFAAGEVYIPAKDDKVHEWYSNVDCYELATGRKTGSLSAPEDDRWYNRACSLAFSPDGKTLAVGEAPRNVRLWDLAANAEAQQITRPLQSSVTAVAFAPNGKWLIAAEGGSYTEPPAEMCLRVLDAATGKELRRFEGGPGSGWLGPAQCLRVAPDGATFMLSLREWRPWNAPGDVVLFRFPVWPERVDPEAAAPHLARLGDEKFAVREAAAAALAALGPAARPFVAKLKDARDPEVRNAVAGILECYDQAYLPVVQAALKEGSGAQAVAYHPDGRHWAAILETDDGCREIVFGAIPESGAELKVQHRIVAPRRPNWLVFLPDGKGLITGNADTTLTLYAPPRR